MSIINDALKKVQSKLTPKIEETPAPLPKEPNKESTYLYDTTPAPETLPPLNTSSKGTVPLNGKGQSPSSPVKNQLTSLLALLCASAIIAGSIWYIYQQFQINIYVAQRLAKKKFYTLIHKKEIPEFKSRSPESLKPLAQLTIASTANTASNSPITLNIHGILSNAKGNLALINDQVYQEGDEIDGAKIIKINLDSVTININGADKTILVKN